MGKCPFPTLHNRPPCLSTAPRSHLMVPPAPMPVSSHLRLRETSEQAASGVYLGYRNHRQHNGEETRVALMDDGRLAEIHIDRGSAESYVGNVYIGRVVRVLPGMQAAFVDIGLERAAFLYAGDIYPAFAEKDDDIDIDDDSDATIAESSPRSKPKNGHPPIQDLVKEGQEILVQVAKDPISTKGARVTTHHSAGSLHGIHANGQPPRHQPSHRP